MKVEHHAAIAVPVSLGIWYFTGSWVYFLLSLFLGIFVDSDHVFDYIREEGKFNFKDMFIKSYKGDFKKLYVIFHSYEYVPIAWAIGLITGNLEFSIVFTIAYLFHMIPDQMANNVRALGYFFLYRAFVGFKMDRVFYSPEHRLQRQIKMTGGK